jgi:hypothetical protein
MIDRLIVNQIAGIEHLEVKPGKINHIRGRTGAGKTSVLAAVEYALTGRHHHARIIRQGADEASIVLTLDDGTQVEQRTVHAGQGANEKGLLTVVKGGMKPQKPREFVAGLAGPYAFRPDEFLSLTDKEKRAVLLSLIEVEMTPAEYQQLVGEGDVLAGLDLAAHPLLVLDEIHRRLFNLRRDLGAQERAQRQMAADLNAQVPAGFDAEAARNLDLTETAQALEEANRFNREREQRLSAQVQRGLEIKHRQEEIARLQAEAARLDDEDMQALLQQQEEGNWFLENPSQDPSPLEAQIRTFQATKQTLVNLESAEAREQEARDLVRRQEATSALLKTVKAKPGELLKGKQIPIEGLGLDDEAGLITIGGRPLQDLSSGEQMELLAKLAVAFAGSLGVVCVDGLEKLDTARRKEFLAAARQTEAQWFIVETTDDDLTVSVDPEEEAAE